MQKSLSLILLVGACVASGCKTWLTTTVKPPVQVTIGAFTHAKSPPGAGMEMEWSVCQVAVTNISQSPILIFQYQVHGQSDKPGYRAFVRKDASSGWNFVSGILGGQTLELAPGAGLVFRDAVSAAFIGQQLRIEVSVCASHDKSKVIVASNEPLIVK